MALDRFAMFYDLRSPFTAIERDAIYDEAAGARQDDRSLLNSVGAHMIALGQAPRRFREIVGDVRGH